MENTRIVEKRNDHRPRPTRRSNVLIMVHRCTRSRDLVPCTGRVRYFRRFCARIIPTICIMIARVGWKLEFSTSHRVRRTSLKFSGGVHTGERHANGSECTKGPDSVEMDSIGDAKDTLKPGNSKGYRALCSGRGRANVISGGNAAEGGGRRREIIKSDGGARGERAREHLEISESPTNYFSPVVCCLKGQDTRHIARDGERGRRGRMEISAGRRPPFPVACKSSLVHFLLSSTLFRHYSSPRTISNPDRRRLPSLFLLFMLKFIGSSALLPFHSAVRRERRKKRWARSKDNTQDVDIYVDPSCNLIATRCDESNHSTN